MPSGGAGKAFDDARGSVSLYVDSFDDARADVDSLIEKQAELSRTISQRWQDAASDSAVLHAWSDVIGELSGRSDLTAGEVEKLKTAVERFNELAGTSYTVAQDAAGAYQVMGDNAVVAADDIAKMVDNMKLQAIADVYAENLRDLVEQQVEAQKVQKQAADDVADAQKRLQEAKDSGDWVAEGMARGELDGPNGLIAKCDRATEAVDSVGRSIDVTCNSMAAFNSATSEGATKLERYIVSNAGLLESFAEAEVDIGGFARQLTDAGMSVEQFQGLTSEQLSQLVSCFSSSSDDMVAALQTFSAQLAESGDTEMAEMVANYAAHLQEMRSQTDANMGEVVATADESMGQAADSAGENADEMMDEWSGGIEEGEGDVESAVGSVVDSAESAMSDYDTHSIGYDFSAGFAQGISDGASLAVNAAAKEARDAVAAARSEARICSPSKVMRGIGSYFSQGFALGIGDGAADVEREARRMASLASRHAARAASVSGDHASYRAALPGGRAQSLSKADLYDAMSAAVKSAGEPVFELNVDGRRLTGAIAGHMESALGAMSVRSYR